MKKILITGVSGFIGSGIAKALSGKYILFGIGRRDHFDSDIQLNYSKLEISNDNAVREYATRHKFDSVIHCAAGLNSSNPSELFDSNIEGTFNILKLALETGCKSIIYISSIPIIGIPKEIPISENHPVSPRSKYHLSKYIGELLLSNQTDLRFVSLRIPAPIGENMPQNRFLPVIIKNCICNTPITLIGNGGRRQNYIDVKDIGQAVINALECNAHGIFNIASRHSISNYDLALLCRKIFNSYSEIVFDGVDPEENLKWEIDVDKAAKELGFIAKTSLEKSIQAIAKML